MTEMSPASMAAAIGTTGIKAPGSTPERTRRGYTPGLAVVNFGIYIGLLTPVMVSMAFKIQRLSPDAAAATANLGTVLGIGALFALIANPLAGRLSDRTTSRWGMRRPWILGGVVTGFLALAVIGIASSIWLIVLAWCVVQVSMNAALAAANATLPDQVPAGRRGAVSGIIGITLPIAMLAGNALVSLVSDDLLRFVLPASVSVAAAVLFVVVLKDRRLESKPEASFGFRDFFGSFVFNPRKHPDFGWTWLTKFLVMFGYAGIATFLPLYLVQNFGLSEQETIQTILLANASSTAAMLISSPLSGWLSDKLGRRKPFVTVAGLVMVVGLVILAFAPNVAVLIIAQTVIGFGSGAFLSVDLALATQVLPNKNDVAKDLGVLNIANALPQSIAPAIAPMVIALGAMTPLGGYTVFYLFGALVALAGALLVHRIKGVN